MTSTICLFDKFDAKKVCFHEPKRTGTGSLTVHMYYDKDSTNAENPIRIQTPRMRAPFGVSCYEAKGAPPRYTLDLSFDNYLEEGTDSKKFFDAWTELDDRNKALSVEKSSVWFGKKMTAEVIDNLYTSAIKPSKKDEYPPTFKCSVPFRNNRFECQFFDQNQVAASGFDVLKGCDVQVIIDVPRLWFMDKQFGCTPIVRSVQFFPSNKLPTEYCFLPREDEARVEEAWAVA